ncbi:alpha/beta hydrolase [Roseibium sp. SCP14]|uniref:alpha/beta hydrolase n=1 Tax=Roseibium sp. SCP14 TaxID=3141375 RepID=UPI0033358B7F
MDETAEFDEQFNLRKRHPIARLHLLKNVIQSHLVQHVQKCLLDVSYGDSSGQKLDIFPAKKAGSPVFVFVHGGYFRALDKRQYRYIAQPLAKLGYTVVLVNYDLAPQVTVSEIVQQVVKSFEWVEANIHRWNGDTDRLTLCGHSVGAFLVTKILETACPKESGVENAILLSGLYDLGPMKRSFLNQDLHLRDADVSMLNARTEALKTQVNLLVAVGGNETEQFVSQSRKFSQDLENAGIHNDLWILQGLNHYTMSRLLSNRRSPVFEWLIRK